MQLSGKISVKKFGAGSKSEHDAVYLETDQGDYVLRKAGANPFEHVGLKEMIGKQVTVEGTLDQYQFLASDIREKQ
jgi:hypothetical protein